MKHAIHRLSGYLGPGTVMEGDLSFEGRFRIDGAFHGRIHSDELLEIGPAGLVDGQVDVAHAVVAGTMTGVNRVRKSLVMESTALVKGELTVASLELQPGARLVARLTRLKGHD